MSSNYTIAFAGMPALLDENERVMEDFTFERYPNAFQRYCDKNKETLKAVEDGYRQVIDKEQFLINMAEELASTAEKMIEKEEKKSAKEKRATNLNMCLVIYTIPAVLELNKESSALFSEKILAAWKAHFPKTSLKASTFKQINAGFKRKFCYITTAVCKTFGKPDDCYELTLLRNYRDQYLMQQENGEEIVYEYYDLAPTIVKHIDQRKDSGEIYRSIWDTYLVPCLSLIEKGENEECRDLYIAMVRDMQKKYFFEEQ